MIDRIKPRFLSSDQDERLVPEGAMFAAKNVRVSNSGEGTEGVLKNMRGTTPIGATAGSELADNDSISVVGVVEDDANGRIYYFVADLEGDSEHAIYYVDVRDYETVLVLKNPNLNFNVNYPVKADIIRGTFLSSSSEEAVIYFTDNYNPPRKININRALSDLSEYNQGSEERFDYVISTIKAASNKPPTVSIVSDTSRSINNINDNLFQFATQIIYKDGEESAVSPYSKIAITRPTYLNALEDQGFGVLNLIDNRIDVSHNVDFNRIPEIDSIRILCRSSNDSSWFVADEYDPVEGKTANIDGTSVSLAAPGSNVYKFYNDSLGSLVSPTVFNKSYDNVPLKARGQAIVNNRLFYSNYTEGFGNVDASSAGLEAVYSDEVSSVTEYIASADIPNMFGTTASDAHITIDFTGGDAFGAGATAGTSLPAGTFTKIQFEYLPTFRVTENSGLVSAHVVDFDNLGESSDVQWTSILFDTPSAPNSSPYFFDLQHTLSVDGTVDDVIEGISDLLFNLEATFSYDISGSDWATENPTITLDNGGSQARATVTVKFDDFTVTGTQLTIRPYPSFIEVWNQGGQVYISNSQYLASGNDQFSDFTSIIDTADPTSSQFASSQAISLSSSFKSGSSHSFGIVYYDKFGRHGFVNPMGSINVKYPALRTTGEGYGSVSVEITFSDPNPSDPTRYDDRWTPPPWADSWQLVYAGSNSFSSYFQYTTGGAYVPVKEDGTVDEKANRVYVSLKTLDKYRDEKGVTRDYSFTKGDKVRVVKHWDTYATPDPTWEYPTASDGSIIEFEAVGVEFLDGNDELSNPLMGVTGVSYTDAEKKAFSGTFLVIESPQINTGINGTDGSVLKYVGFDWQSIAQFQEPGTTFYYNDISDTQATAGKNAWGKNTVIDIVTPRKRTSEQVYYETGISGNVTRIPGRRHGSYVINTSSSDCYLRPVACKTPIVPNTSAPHSWNRDNPDEWGYKTIYIEDDSVTDRIVSSSWNRGKPHVIYNMAKEVVRTNSITYSDRYNVDVETLALSSFNAGTVNYANYSSKFGAVNAIANYDDQLLALQENKVSIVPVSKSVFNQAAGGDGVVSLSTNVVEEGAINYLSGDWGCGNNPESLLIYDTQVFFADPSRGKVIRLTREGLSPISEKGVSSFISDVFKVFNAASGTKRVISGYEPDSNTYFVTINMRYISGNNFSETLSYDVASGAWISTHSFIPDWYSRMDDDMYSFRYLYRADDPEEGVVLEDLVAWKHDELANRNQFYNTNYNSEITVISKYDPSMPKIFNALSLNGDAAWGAVVTSSSGAATSSGKMPATSFSELEDQYYRNIPGDSTTTSSAHASGIGTASSVDSATITFSNKLRGMHIPVGATVKFVNGSNLTDLATGGVTVVSVDQAAKTVTVSDPITATIDGKEIVILNNQTSDGDRIRGHYAKIELTKSGTSPVELYSVDVNFTNSRPNYALGQ